MLEVIYVVRHGYRTSWSVDYATGEYRISAPTPTGIPADPPLVAYGVDQSRQLAAHVMSLQPPVDVVYSSPWYRCLQTLAPTIDALKKDRGKDVEVLVENGVADFFGRAHFDHPAPASLDVLRDFFDFVSPHHRPYIHPARQGESQMAVHHRHAYAMRRIIESIDAMGPNGPKALLLCTHAASMICIGRALTGQLPDDLDTEDFRCGTCAMSTYRRRTLNQSADPKLSEWLADRPDEIPQFKWSGGVGVSGGWDCEKNGDCSFLSGGEERTWRFQGDESFVDFSSTAKSNKSATTSAIAVDKGPKL